jgi:hypothetical protein
VPLSAPSGYPVLLIGGSRDRRLWSTLEYLHNCLEREQPPMGIVTTAGTGLNKIHAQLDGAIDHSFSARIASAYNMVGAHDMGSL